MITSYAKFRALSAALPMLIAAGCAGTPPVDPAATIQSDADAYYLIGVKPAKAVISLATGTIRDGAYYADGVVMVTQTFAGSPVDGFVLARVLPGTKQGIRIIRMNDSAFASVYVPCLTDAPTLVFDTVAGKVAYAGSVQYDYDAGGVTTLFGDNFEAARAFLQRRYPQFVDKLVRAPAQHVPAKRC